MSRESCNIFYENPTMKVGDNRFLFRSSAFMFNFAPHAKTGLEKKEADTRRSPPTTPPITFQAKSRMKNTRGFPHDKFSSFELKSNSLKMAKVDKKFLDSELYSDDRLEVFQRIFGRQVS